MGTKRLPLSQGTEALRSAGKAGHAEVRDQIITSPEPGALPCLPSCSSSSTSPSTLPEASAHCSSPSEGSALVHSRCLHVRFPSHDRCFPSPATWQISIHSSNGHELKTHGGYRCVFSDPWEILKIRTFNVNTLRFPVSPAQMKDLVTLIPHCHMATIGRG